MPRKQQGARLYLRERKGRAPVFVIRDADGHEQSTGCGAGERAAAETALARYITGKHSSAVGTHDPGALPVADVLDFYAEVKAAKPGDSKSKIRATEHREFMVAPLLEFMGDKPVSAIRGALCRDYVRWRTHEGPAPASWPKRHERVVSDQTARRELVVLSAAVNLYHKEFGLDAVPIVTMPGIARTRRRALTHAQAAALLAGALGFYRDADGKVRRRPRSTRTQRKRTARLIIIGLYSGTRSGAIQDARWLLCLDGPWIDVDRGILHRLGDLEEETNKRRPPARIPPRLLTHLRRWRRMDGRTLYVVSWRGRKVGRVKRSFAAAVALAGLPDTVTPHVLKHTSISWAVQGGVKLQKIADFYSTSVAMIEKVYGHLIPGRHDDVHDALR